MELDFALSEIYPLPLDAKQKLKACITEVSYPKGHLLISAHKVEKDVYIVKEGIVRAYVSTEYGQVTFWFGKEGDPVLSMKSYVADQKSYEDIEVLEHSTFYKLKTEALKSLYQSDIHIANWGRKFIEFELMKTEERLISMQFKTAAQRYSELMENYPELLQRIQLGHIASYLGITQVSLSRIRAEIK